MASKKKRKAPPAATRSASFKCGECGKVSSRELAPNESTPTRVDCDHCGARDAATPAP